jgi:redox-sensitive bicupin YhaK (pirin superfamily)
MMYVRKVKKIKDSISTVEGAGVHLYRAFGFQETELTDPFLLLDDFHGNDYSKYMAGFPWHPHRGIETVTYMINGAVEHGDSLGNTGIIESGDVQWMTAGRGIIHQEMPRKALGFMQGFQLWVNLPESQKMMIPRYRDILSDDIPEMLIDNSTVKVIAGDVCGIKGPVRDLVVDVEYLDIAMLPDSKFIRRTKKDDTVFAYVFQGEAVVDGNLVGTGTLAVFNSGDYVEFKSRKDGVRFLLVSGTPLKEPVAWRGPIVMNTQAELNLAFKELNEDTFIKK